jgi:DNA-binding MarR family transcriptional regulator
MSAEKTAEQFMELLKRFVNLRPKLVLSEHASQFKKKMEGVRSKFESPEDRSFLFRILILLAQSDEPLTMSALSTELNVPMSSATRLVDWLVTSDFVERINDLNDRRVVRVGMSKSGRELYEQGMNHNKQRITRLLKDFSNEEQSQLLKLMNKLFDSLEAESEEQK